MDILISIIASLSESSKPQGTQERIELIMQKMAEERSKKQIIIEDESLDAVPPELWKDREIADQLEILCLGKNNISSLPIHFSLFTNLRFLSLETNNFTVFPKELIICGLTRLEVLNMSHNQLPFIPKEFFLNCIQLTTLNFSDNDLHSIPREIGTCQFLKMLDFSQNKLETIPETFAILRNVTTLILKSNYITRIPPGCISGMVSLRELQLQRNNLEVLPTKELYNMKFLVKLDVSHNYLSGEALFGIWRLKNLKKLLFNGNDIYSIPTLDCYLPNKILSPKEFQQDLNLDQQEKEFLLMKVRQQNLKFLKKSERRDRLTNKDFSQENIDHFNSAIYDHVHNVYNAFASKTPKPKPVSQQQKVEDIKKKKKEEEVKKQKEKTEKFRSSASNDSIKSNSSAASQSKTSNTPTGDSNTKKKLSHSNSKQSVQSEKQGISALKRDNSKNGFLTGESSGSDSRGGSSDARITKDKKNLKEKEQESNEELNGIDTIDDDFYFIDENQSDNNSENVSTDVSEESIANAEDEAEELEQEPDQEIEVENEPETQTNEEIKSKDKEKEKTIKKKQQTTSAKKEKIPPMTDERAYYLEHVNPMKLGAMRFIESANFSNNHLTTFPIVIPKIAYALVELDLRNNKIDSFSAKTLRSLTFLKRLTLAHNELRAVPPEFSNLKNLLYCDLSHNKIETIHPFAFVPPSNPTKGGASLPKVTSSSSLNALGAQMGGIFGNIIGGNLNTASDTKMNSKIEQTPFTMIMNTKSFKTNPMKLKILKLDHNRLKNLPQTIENCRKLSKVMLRNNELTALPNEIVNLKHLRFLDVSNNKLKKLPRRIQKLPKLRKLHIHNNAIEKLPPTITQLKNLVYFSFKDNPFLEVLIRERARLGGGVVVPVVKATAAKERAKTSSSGAKTPTTPKSPRNKQNKEEKENDQSADSTFYDCTELITEKPEENEDEDEDDLSDDDDEDDEDTTQEEGDDQNEDDEDDENGNRKASGGRASLIENHFQYLDLSELLFGYQNPEDMQQAKLQSFEQENDDGSDVKYELRPDKDRTINDLINLTPSEPLMCSIQ